MKWHFPWQPLFVQEKLPKFSANSMMRRRRLLDDLVDFPLPPVDDLQLRSPASPNIGDLNCRRRLIGDRSILGGKRYEISSWKTLKWFWDPHRWLSHRLNTTTLHFSSKRFFLEQPSSISHDISSSHDLIEKNNKQSTILTPQRKKTIINVPPGLLHHSFEWRWVLSRTEHSLSTVISGTYRLPPYKNSIFLFQYPNPC